MRFRFDANQEYQQDAIRAVADLFEGQPRIVPDMRFALGAGFAAVSNRLDIAAEDLLANLRAVQAGFGIEPDSDLKTLGDTVSTAEGDAEIALPNFSVEMETGTGKVLCVKLPPWFTVQTPVGEYNPDWAIVMRDADDADGEDGKPLLYLVRETKGAGELRPTEQRKTVCGKAHFEGALNVSYKVLTEAGELP